MKYLSLTVVMLASLLTGCQTYDPYTGEKKTSNTMKGGAWGALAGAAIGAATASKKDRKKAMLRGAAAGGAIGAGIGNYMDRQEAQLRQKLMSTGVQVYRNGDEITLIMPGNITFDPGRAEVKSAFHNVLSSVGNVLAEYKKTDIEVSGYTDSRGSFELNQRLSEDRAMNVASYLIAQGVDSSRLSHLGYGPRNPIRSNGTPEGRAANRRVELKLMM